MHNEQDSEECVNDTYFNAWGNIPPHNPDKLSSYLGKITRNLALNKWDYYNADKRGNGQVLAVLEELQGCIPSSDTVEQIVDEIHFANIYNNFLASLPKQKRIIFMRRYWYSMSLKDIARGMRLSENHVGVILHRTRNKFKNHLTKEGILI